MSRLVVAGAGYVGLATAVGFAKHGHRVTVVDIDRDRVRSLQAGRLPFHEPSLSGALGAALRDRLDVTDAYPASAPPADVAFVCVNTPPAGDGSLDCRAVLAASIALAEAWQPPVIAIRSTVNPGTATAVERALAERGLRGSVLFNPEFLREGRALEDFEGSLRRVIGGADEDAVEALESLYTFSSAPTLRTDAVSAELIKLGTNSALAVRVSLANELARIADGVGANVDDVLAGVTGDPRIGSAYFVPGIGFGGSCLPKDIGAMRAAARGAGRPSHVFDASVEANEHAIEAVVHACQQHLADRTDAVVGLIGLGFKPGTDSIRDSRPLALACELLRRGIAVAAYDPLAEANARSVLGDQVRYAATPSDLFDLSCVVVLSHGRQTLEGRVPRSVPVLDGLGHRIAEEG